MDITYVVFRGESRAKCISFIYWCLSKITSHPNNDDYKMINASNDLYMDLLMKELMIDSLDPLIKFWQSIGFVKTPNGKYLTLSNSTSMDQIATVKYQIEQLIANQYQPRHAPRFNASHNCNSSSTRLNNNHNTNTNNHARSIPQQQQQTLQHSTACAPVTMNSHNHGDWNYDYNYKYHYQNSHNNSSIDKVNNNIRCNNNTIATPNHSPNDTNDRYTYTMGPYESNDSVSVSPGYAPSTMSRNSASTRASTLSQWTQASNTPSNITSHTHVSHGSQSYDTSNNNIKSNDSNLQWHGETKYYHDDKIDYNKTQLT